MLVPFQFTTQTIDTMCRLSPRITKNRHIDSQLRRFWVYDVLETWRRKGVLVCDRREFDMLYENWYEKLPDYIKALYDITKLPRVDRNKFQFVESEFPSKLITLVCNIQGLNFERKCIDGSENIEAVFYAFSKTQQINDMHNLTQITTNLSSNRSERFRKLILPFISIEKASYISIFDPYAINWNGHNGNLYAILELINEYAAKLGVEKSISIYAIKNYNNHDQEIFQNISAKMNEMRMTIDNYKHIKVTTYTHVYKTETLYKYHKSYIHDRFFKFGDNHVLDIGRGVSLFKDTNRTSYYSTFVAHKLVEVVSEYKEHIDNFMRAGRILAINSKQDNVIEVDV